jgi:hypothetical protein
MKIQLERKLTNQSDRLSCVACQQRFGGDRLRTLLSHDQGSIVGDLCTGCLKQGTNHIQARLKARSIELFQQSSIDSDSDLALATYRQALELSELAAEALTIPPFYYRWWKHLTMFAADSQELEIARRDAANYRYRQPKSHHITFLTEEPFGGKDY